MSGSFWGTPLSKAHTASLIPDSPTSGQTDVGLAFQEEVQRPQLSWLAGRGCSLCVAGWEGMLPVRGWPGGDAPCVWLAGKGCSLRVSGPHNWPHPLHGVHVSVPGLLAGASSRGPTWGASLTPS